MATLCPYHYKKVDQTASHIFLHIPLYCFTFACIPSYDYAMNLNMNDCNGFCPLSYLDSPFHDFYAFEGYQTFSETESSFASSNTNDHQHHFHISSSSFHSPNHQEAQHQSSYCQEFNDEYRSWSFEELMPNDNEKVSLWQYFACFSFQKVSIMIKLISFSFGFNTTFFHFCIGF